MRFDDVNWCHRCKMYWGRDTRVPQSSCLVMHGLHIPDTCCHYGWTLMQVEPAPPRRAPEIDWCKTHGKNRCKPGVGTSSDGRHCYAHMHECDFTDDEAEVLDAVHSGVGTSR